MTTAEIAKALDMHPKRVIEIEKGALKKLSSPKFRAKWDSIHECLFEIEKEKANTLVPTLKEVSRSGDV